MLFIKSRSLSIFVLLCTSLFQLAVTPLAAGSSVNVSDDNANATDVNFTNATNVTLIEDTE